MASTELEVQRVMNPATAEVLALDAPSEDLAAALDQAREMEKALYAFRKEVGEEVLRRMDAEALWTMRVGGYEVKSESPAPRVEYDGMQLAINVAQLTEEGKITADAANAAVEQVIHYKPKTKGINALIKLGGEIAQRIRDTGKTVPHERRPPGVKKVA